MIDTQNEAPTPGVDDMLAAYVAGSLSHPLHVLMASHLELSSRHHALVATLEAACGDQLADLPPQPLADPQRMLADITAARPSSTLPGVMAPSGGDDGLPPTLSTFLGKPLGELPWRRVMPGLKEVRLGNNDEGEVSLLLVSAGRRMPAHTHAGREVTLIIKGSFSDDHGTFARGDISIADSHVDHRPRAGADEDCLCFVVTDAPLRLTGTFGRLVQRILKH